MLPRPIKLRVVRKLALPRQRDFHVLHPYPLSPPLGSPILLLGVGTPPTPPPILIFIRRRISLITWTHSWLTPWRQEHENISWITYDWHVSGMTKSTMMRREVHSVCLMTTNGGCCGLTICLMPCWNCLPTGFG